MSKRCAFILLIGLGLILALVAGCGSSVVATVNNKKITEKQLNERLRKVAGGLVLQSMLENQVYEDAFTKAGLKLTDEEINKGVAAKYGSKEQLDQTAQKEGLTSDFVIEVQIKPELMKDKVIESKIKVEDKDLKAMYDQMPTAFDKPATATFRLILTADGQKAQEALAKVKGGMSFEDAVAKYSVDPRSRQEGGLVPGYPVAGLPAEVQDLKEGQVSPAIQGAQGWAIFKIIERVPGQKRTLAQAQSDVRTVYVIREKANQSAAIERQISRAEANISIVDPQFKSLEEKLADIKATYKEQQGGAEAGTKPGETRPSTGAAGQPSGTTQPSGAAPPSAGTPRAPATSATPARPSPSFPFHTQQLPATVLVRTVAADDRQRCGMQEFDDLVEIMACLRGPEGCPWDHEQTHASLTRHLIEECFELVEALENQDAPLICEELGDVLLQVVFHAQIAAEEGEFDLRDVVGGIVEKLRYRHPHVFGEVQVASSDEVLHNWEQLKRAEAGKPERTSALEGIPLLLPALQRAEKLQKRAARVGFDWEDVSGPREKVAEELAELDGAQGSGDPEAVKQELGDLLLAVVNLSRFLSVDPEQALREANRRFEHRFRRVEETAEAQGRRLEDMTLAEMDVIWDTVKASNDET